MWGLIEPIVSMVLWVIFRAALIIFCNVIFFYAIYQLLSRQLKPIGLDAISPC